MKFMRKPKVDVVEAVQWNGLGRDVRAFEEFGASVKFGDCETLLLFCWVDGAQGWVPVPLGHWVMRSAPNDFYPVEDVYMKENFDVVPE